MLSVGLIGYGAIGKDVVSYLKENKVPGAKVEYILVRNLDQYEEAVPDGFIVTDDEETFFSSGLDVIIECAGHEAVYQYAVKSLSSGSHFITVSIGAFSDRELYESVIETAKRSNRKLILPSAAIGGLDRIAASSINELEEVKLITRKPPAAWRGTIAEESVDLDTISEQHIIYEGTARESAKLFPQSTNVSAALSIAGVGFDQTEVQVLVDPDVEHNTHQIIAKGYFGEVELTIQNTPSAENPKSGYIVAMSICKALNNLISPVVIGI
ncbi:aspartate dehydrogenase [Rossellomorea aquimaris]|uniref:aspartate dehydrogenase n=1 Tax=Rossellomorea aquimaris TaxID=189382 RepID=UPI001CD4E66C|nr:aspartate dehydrogenase [Rossellomorea aquimaris]MCA1055218.1 aspartate dehydrogenase [Rossellomorea aquimaris]